MADKLTVREYTPGPNTLVYVPFNPAPYTTSKCYRPDGTCVQHTWERLWDEQVFTLKIDFNFLGDWIFVLKENGTSTIIFKAKVIP